MYSGLDALMKSENFQQPMLLGYETLVTVVATTNLPWHIHLDMVSIVSMTKCVNMFSLIQGQIQSICTGGKQLSGATTNCHS